MNDHPEIDDDGPLSGLDWVDNDPMCEHCADTQWRPFVAADGLATFKPCDRCFLGEDA